jgi:hypothetical protein
MLVGKKYPVPFTGEGPYQLFSDSFGTPGDKNIFHGCWN